MSDSLRQPLSLAGLPFDVLLRIFSECDVGDVLNLSATCKMLNEASGEHQTWLNQAKRLQIPISTGVVPSTAELKDLAVSWLRSDKLWVKPRDDGDERLLGLHCFRMGLFDDDEPVRFVMANFIPGGRFVVVLYPDGNIDLKEIDIKPEGEWELRDVARYRQDDPERFHVLESSQLLTETNIGRPLVAYVDRAGENLLVFLVDHIAGTIEQRQAISIGDTHFYGIYSIQARGNAILCFCEHGRGWGIIASELGPDPTPKIFSLGISQGSQAQDIQCFMVSENAVVIYDPAGIHLYHIPELSSAENFSTLKPIWEWRGESKPSRESVCMTFSYPMLYLHDASTTHTIVFRMDASGRDPVVAEHRTSGRLPSYLTPFGGENDHHFVIKGRKGLHYDLDDGYPKFDTFLLGIEELAGGFSGDLELPDDDDWGVQEIRFVDFDERTGRVLIGTNRDGEYNKSEAIRIYLADLPP